MGKKKKRNGKNLTVKTEVVPAPVNGKPVRKTLHQVRRFEGGSHSRLRSWPMASPASIDQDIYDGLETMRSYSRSLFQNDPYAKRFISRLKSKCIGSNGITLQVQGMSNGNLDETNNQRIEDYYKRWSEKGNYDASGRLTRAAGEKLMLHTEAQDGEVLIRIHRGFPDNEFGYTLEFLDPARLDIRLNRMLQNGNRIVMGVELNTYNRPVAYHVLLNHPYPYVTNQRIYGDQHERVPAQDIIHEFVAIGNEQTRGVPWVHAAVNMLQDTHGYREAAIINARWGASKMLFIKSPSGEGYTGSDEDDLGNKLESVEPGTIGELAADEELAPFDPNYPDQQFDGFHRALLKGVAVALDTNYHSLSGDLENVNLSSARAGDRDEQDVLVGIQQIIIDIENRVYRDFLSYSIDTGRLAILPSRERDFHNVNWRPKRWQNLDEHKQAQANELNLQNYLQSPIQIISDQYGRDPQDVVNEFSRFRDMLQAAGLPPPSTDRRPVNETEASSNE